MVKSECRNEHVFMYFGIHLDDNIRQSVLLKKYMYVIGSSPDIILRRFICM